MWKTPTRDHLDLARMQTTLLGNYPRWTSQEVRRILCHLVIIIIIIIINLQ
jgi:hypothetical protein